MFCWLCWELSAPEEFTTTEEGCGRKFLTRILCVCVWQGEKGWFVSVCKKHSFCCILQNKQKYFKNIMYMKWGPENKHSSVYLVRNEDFPLSSDSHRRVFSFIWSPAGIFNFLWYIGYLWSVADLHFWKLRSYPQKQDQPRKLQWASLHMPVTISLVRAPKWAALRIRGQFSHRQGWGHFVRYLLVCREMGCDHFILATECAYTCCSQLELASSRAKFL